MISIINYGVGNLLSIQKMIHRIGAPVNIVSNPIEISTADKLILPGVGAFDNCMNKFKSSGLLDVVKDKVMSQKIPLLGICVGMQMLTEESQEGKEKGLGWVNGKTVKFNANCLQSFQKVPHMGWSSVKMMKSSPLLQSFNHDTRFYFVHSYHIELLNESEELLQCNYGYNFTAALEKNNILGVQFHPEKSHRFGLQLFENFVKNY